MLLVIWPMIVQKQKQVTHLVSARPLNHKLLHQQQQRYLPIQLLSLDRVVYPMVGKRVASKVARRVGGMAAWMDDQWAAW